jgi:inhibitor of KinA sporulation pathway (predicted exonuclease)
MPRIDSYPDPRLESWPAGGMVVLFDLEYTSWPGSLERNWSLPCEYREIVQFGAVKAQVINIGFKAIKTFDCLVRPVINSRLSGHFVGLTGITGERIERDGEAFAGAWDAFCRFCADASQLWCLGRDGEVLRENFILRQIDGVLPAPCFDIRPALARVLALKQDEVVSSRLPELLHLEPVGRAHQAGSDALAVLNALDHLARQGRLA